MKGEKIPYRQGKKQPNGFCLSYVSEHTGSHHIFGNLHELEASKASWSSI